MRIIKGDLLALAKSGHFDVIIHGCNCHCAMGKGIAKFIKREFPEAYQADKRTIKGDRSKLGTISYAEIITNNNSRENGYHDRLVVVNAYTQYNYDGADVLVDYDAVRTSFQQVRKEFSGLRIGYPKIGAGLAGGDWDLISDIIGGVLENEDHTLVVLDN